jgi:ankyrin repeat protein
MSENKPNHQDIFDAIARGDLNAVAEYLRQGGDPNLRGEDGDTLLHYAIRKRQYEIAELLLKHGADPNAMADGKMTPLHYATLHGDPLFVRLLLEYKAYPNAKDYEGRTPLHIATWYGHDSVTLALLEYGADPTVTDDMGRTPFINLHAEFLRVLDAMTRSMNPDKRDEKGRTILHNLAVFCDYYLVEHILLSRDVDVNAKDNDGNTALHLAVASEIASDEACLRTAEVLLEHGADPKIKNNKGKTPIDLARREGRREIVGLLRKAILKRTVSQEN